MIKSELVDIIKSKIKHLAQKKITIGFDGFSDTILKVIRHKNEHEQNGYFTSINEFGKYILAKGEKNFSLELEEMKTKIGGNMPIMANALAQFGPKQSCIGSLGFPEIHPVFSQMPDNCEFFSFANPGFAKAMEFNGRKIILAEIGKLNCIKWETIKETVGHETMSELFSKRDLIGILNWSELDNSTEIWKGLLEDILPFLPQDQKKPIGFFDLADCSKRNASSINEAMELLKSFSNYWQVVLSLNLNEAIIVNNVLKPQRQAVTEIEQMGQNIFEELSINTVIIHHSKQSIAWNRSGVYIKESFYVSNPVLSTGAGDNFNAGFCAGMLMGLDTDSSLIIGHATSAHYMEYGQSPTLEDLLTSLSVKTSTYKLADIK